MTWYKIIFSRILKGTVLFMLPLVILIFILEIAVIITKGLILPITEFLPEPPDRKSGELKLIQQSKLKPLDMPLSKVIGIILKFGKGTEQMI